MKFSRTIKVDGDKENIDIKITYSTPDGHLTAGESKSAFAYFIDSMMRALERNYHYEDIKLIKGGK